jgi:hypothetical protein
MRAQPEQTSENSGAGEYRRADLQRAPQALATQEPIELPPSFRTHGHGKTFRADVRGNPKSYLAPRQARLDAASGRTDPSGPRVMPSTGAAG